MRYKNPNSLIFQEQIAKFGFKLCFSASIFAVVILSISFVINFDTIKSSEIFLEIVILLVLNVAWYLIFRLIKLRNIRLGINN